MLYRDDLPGVCIKLNRREFAVIRHGRSAVEFVSSTPYRYYVRRLSCAVEVRISKCFATNTLVFLPKERVTDGQQTGTKYSRLLSQYCA